jgi:hypothetical protein
MRGWRLNLVLLSLLLPVLQKSLAGQRKRLPPSQSGLRWM